MTKPNWIVAITISTLALAVGCSGSSADDCTDDYMEMCDGVCVNTHTNKDHCGGCNNACGGDAICVDGLCDCSGDLEYCSGTCVNTNTDNAHCGECLHPCTGDTQCHQATCISPFEESCDGEDNDFDGHVDEAADGTPLTRSCDNLCGAGEETCTNGEYTGCTAPTPEAEVCDGADNNCDGLIDEGVTNTYYEDYDLDGYGDPDLAWSTEACELPTGPSPNGGVWVDDNTDCDDVDDTIYPGAEELCDDWDNDCDDDVDEGCACSPIDSVRDCGTDEGVCVHGTQTCTDTGWSDCAGDDYVPPLLGELCNHLDDDCDGEIDEELNDDAYETNDTCALARQLPDVLEGSSAVEASPLSLYHGAGTDVDSDWFEVHADEGFHFDCIVHPGDEQCDFLFLAALNVPSDAVHEDYVMCVHTGTCGDFDYSFCTDDPGIAYYDSSAARYEMLLTWTGICGLEDAWDFYIEVKYAAEAPISCDTYELEFAMTWDGDIQSSCD